MTRNAARRIGLLVSLAALIALNTATIPAQDDLRPTRTDVTVARPTSNVGQPVRVTADVTVLGPDVAIAGGTVEFFSGNESLGAASLLAGANIATASIDVTLPAGIHPIIARYLGDSTFAFSISAPPVPHEVLPDPSVP